MKLDIKTDVSTEPVLAADMRAWLGIDSTAQDSLLASMAKVARIKVEQLLGKAICERTYTYSFETDYIEVELPYHPIVSITSVKQLSTDGTSTTLSSSSYALTNNCLYLLSTGIYEVEYKAGISAKENEKQLIMKQAAWDYLHRGDSETSTYSPDVVNECKMYTINKGY